MQVVVNNPPNLYNETGRQEFIRLMSAFEGTKYTMKHNATVSFTLNFMRKLNKIIKLNFNVKTEMFLILTIENGMSKIYKAT